MMTKHYDFIFDDGKEYIDGKVFWPNYCHLWISNTSIALEIAENIIRQVKNRTSDNDKTDIGIPLRGRLIESDK